MKHLATHALPLAAAVGLAGCGENRRAANAESSTSGGDTSTSGVADSGPGRGATSTSTSKSTSGSDGSSRGEGDDGPKFDIGDTAASDESGAPVDVCKVQDDDAVIPCEEHAPPDSFAPDVQWTWTGAVHTSAIVTPLVANLTDDNADGEIDLCDTPDVIVVTNTGQGRIHILNGADGVEHFEIGMDVHNRVTPSIGDIDADGIPEIVTATPNGNMLAFEHDGTMKWQSSDTWPSAVHGSVALADVDNDGDVEIIAGETLWDHDGNRIEIFGDIPGPGSYGNAVTAADLDGDDDLEIILGRSAYHHDGTEVYKHLQIDPGYPQVGDIDADGEPEVLLMNPDGINVFENNGTIKFQGLHPTGDSGILQTWMRPATIHDFDGDGEAEWAVSSANHYTTYEQDATIIWSSDVSDQSGSAAGTAFDFLGDGTAEAMYADESTLFIFDDAGGVLLMTPRSSTTAIEYPTVADIDNDGSAEIVVVSNTSPTVQAIRDVDERWVPARRIWNQHTYHVTNVREDGTIPQVEKHSWELLNTFRTQAQMENGICNPEPEG